MKYKLFNLDNGARLGIVALPKAPSVTISVYLPAGIRYDPPDKPGVAHLTEHMLLSGTNKFPTSKELSAATARFGGWQSAFTWIDYQVHTVKLPIKRLNAGVEVLKETLVSPLLRQHELEKEKNVVKEEISRNKADPEKAVWEYVWNKVFWHGTKLARPYTGMSKDVEAIQIEDIKSFKKRYLRLNKAVFMIAGDLEFNKTYELINSIFGQMKGKGEGSVPIYPSSGGKIKLIEGKGETSQLMFGFKTVPASHKDTHVLEMIVQLLGGSFASKLIDRLREEGGFIYSWDMWQDLLQNTGYLFFKTATKNTQLMSIFKIICEEFNNLKKELVNTENLALAKQYSVGSLFVNTETTTSYSKWFGLQEFLAGKSYTPQEQAAIYKRITRGDIQEIANKYFTFDNWYIAILGQGNKEKIKALIDSDLS